MASRRGIIWLLSLTVYGFICVVAFSHINYLPSFELQAMVISVVTCFLLIWLYKVIFVYPIVSRTNDTIFRSLILPFRLKEFGIALIGILLASLPLLVLVIKGTILAASATLSILPLESFETSVKCEYSRSGKSGRVWNYLFDEKGRELVYLSTEHHCGVYYTKSKDCVLLGTRSWFGEYYSALKCE